jgi:hypothetical protein
MWTQTYVHPQFVVVVVVVADYFFNTKAVKDYCLGEGCNPIEPPINLKSCPFPDK